MTAPTPGSFLDSLSSAERKQVALSRGLFAYFPDALALVARHSVISNEKHNPGTEPHWAREKSSDHEDCIGRHSLSVAIDPDSLDDGQPHIVCRAWRALAALQLWAEKQKAPAKAADGDWTPWYGEENVDCPPGTKGKRVEVLFRGGSTDVDRSSAYYWKHDGDAADIVAYRVVP